MLQLIINEVYTHETYILSFVDYDECLLSPCHRNASCNNTPGSFECQCDSGWTGDGFTCEGKRTENFIQNYVVFPFENEQVYTINSFFKRY